jgi:hypothetical protein
MEFMISCPVIDCFSESLFRDHIRRVLQIKTLYLCIGSQENVFSCEASTRQNRIGFEDVLSQGEIFRGVIQNASSHCHRQGRESELG